MAQCPNCQRPVEILDKHLGTLFTCPHCNAVFFVDWNGQPEMAQHLTEEQGQIVNEVVAFSDANSEFNSQSDLNSEPETETTPEPEPEPEIESPSEFLPAPEMSDAIEAYDFNQSLDGQPPQPMQVLTNDSADFSDVSDFANASTDLGPISYVVIVDGIESSHLFKLLKEAMSDSRFGWDVQEILKDMAGGRLVLTGLSPAKASVLINRIKYLPLKISWRQDVLSSN